ncbi:MAG: formylglycine-generating enzyme family protein [Gemmataceae bacterium]
MKLVRLPGGTVVLGSPADEPGRQPDEPIPAEATVPGPLYVSATEVTHGQFQAVLGRSPAAWPRKLRQGQAVAVDSVTWAEADEFCRRLTEREPGRAGWAYRLPSEAEWEYACRAGTTTPFWSGPRVAFGRQAVFNPDDDPHGQADPAMGKRAVEKGVPHPAGTGGPNPFGLFDTNGGVWEWVADAVPGGQRVVRGGSWREPAANCRSASRRVVPSDERRDDVGFRVVYASVR